MPQTLNTNPTPEHRKEFQEQILRCLADNLLKRVKRRRQAFLFGFEKKNGTPITERLKSYMIEAHEIKKEKSKKLRESVQ